MFDALLVLEGGIRGSRSVYAGVQNVVIFVQIPTPSQPLAEYRRKKLKIISKFRYFWWVPMFASIVVKELYRAINIVLR